MISSVLFLLACGDSTPSDAPAVQPKAEPQKVLKPEPKRDPVEPPKAMQQPLEGGPFPGILLTQAWFWTDEYNKPKPGPARLEIWRQGPDGWMMTRVEDSESNVFHKALSYQGGILTIGAEGALMKKWTFSEGKWSGELLWKQSWGGRFNRLRDIEVGDVDHADGITKHRSLAADGFEPVLAVRPSSRGSKLI